MSDGSVGFRYDTGGKWFKGNTHIHSTVSDGGMEFPEIAKMYAGAGYDFLFRTDHESPSDISSDGADYPLLWLDGVELGGDDHTGAHYHVVCLGTLRDLPSEDGFEACLLSAREQGALLVLAHPRWMGNSLEDALRWQFDGVEIYNHLCRWLNGKGGGLVHWDAMLKDNPDTLAFCVDDAHLSGEHPGWNGGWIVVNASECTPDAILGAIRKGNYYSSRGPEFHSIEFDGENVNIRTSSVQFIRLVGEAWDGTRLGTFSDERTTEASIPVPPGWRSVYLDIEDENGKRAWTNNLLTAQ